MMTELSLRAVAYREGGVYVMQGIEHDIAVHADDLSALVDEFERAVVENCAITAHLGRAPLEGIKPAPRRFLEMFERAVLALTPLQDRKMGEHADLNVRYADESGSLQ